MPFTELINPPIVESVIILQFKDEVDEKYIEAFCESPFIRSNYEVDRPVRSPSNQPSRQYSYTLKSSEGNRVLRLDLDSLSFHRLSYIPFEAFFDEFDQIVESFLVTSKSLGTEKEFTVDMITLRYVNVIQVEGDTQGLIDTARYVTLNVQTPFVLNNSFLQVGVTNEEDKDIHGVVIQALKSNEEGTSIEGIIVDIQVFRKLGVAYNRRLIKEYFWGLRSYKNFLFFKIIHPDVIRTYQ